MSWRAVMLVGATVACALACSTAPSDVDSIAMELGEPRDGFPSWDERVIHVWTNRARAAPSDDLASCTQCAERACYSPQPPLGWQHGLARAARFHADFLQRAGCGNIQHNSPCTLVSDIATRYTPGACNGDPSCACVPGTFACYSNGTTTWDRLAAFGYGFGGRGENITASRTDPLSSFYQWMYEPDTSSTCEVRYANGHRYSILNPSFTGIGVGKGTAGTGWDVWVQEFTAESVPPVGIVAGVHYPRTGSTIAFRANWYGSAPTLTEVNVDGVCQSMSLERGTTTNGTWLSTLGGLSTGCHRYSFRFASSDGEQTFPSTGSFGIGCAGDWDPTAPPPCGTTGGSSGATDAGVSATDAGSVDAGQRRRGRKIRS